MGMRRLLLATACLVLVTMAARAADPAQWVAPVSVPHVWTKSYDWTGFYVGLHGGYTGGSTNAGFTGFPELDFPLVRSFSIGTSGFIGGGQIGYNYQIGKLVIGTESDISWVNNKASSFSSGSIFGVPFTLGATQGLDWLSTTRVRLGLTPADRVLFYGTGGLAVGHVSASTNLGFPLISYIGADSSMRAGWTAGAGAEYAVGNNLTARLEYLYYDLGGASVVGFPNLFNPPFETHTHFSMTGQIVRGGVNYKVDWPAPWAAPAPVFAVKAPPQHELELESGVRYWYSIGKTSKDLLSSDGSALVSRLTYSGLAAQAGESFVRVDHWSGVFAKGYVGTGAVNSGHLKDEDFPPFIAPYSATSSDQKDGLISYFDADVGYNFLRGSGYRLGAFGGYHYYHEKVNAMGCVQTAGNPLICVPSISDAVQGITNDAEWHSWRIGLNGSVLLAERLKFTADAAWVPSTWLSNQDSHWLRIGSDFNGPVPEDGKGSGWQLEGVLSYQVTPAFSVGAGGRYWHLETNGDSHFENATPFGGPQPVSFKTDRYGGFIQSAFRF